MTSEDAQRMEEILAFTSNIGHAADIVHSGLLSHASRLRKQGWSLSPDQRAQLDESLGHLLSNERRAAALFVNADLRQARALAGEKEHFRALEAQASEAHLEKIKSGQIDAAEVGQLYLDILRDVKGVNSYLVGAAAYPVLAREGELLPSRLRETAN
jgi:phosphate:Na+ symporter